MSIDGVDQTRAKAALTVVSSDNNARERFIAAYSWRGDAIEALRQAATDEIPPTIDTLSELHKRAFGRTHSPAEEDAATAARAALATAKADRAAESTALRAAILATEEWASSHPTTLDDPGSLSEGQPAAEPMHTEPAPETRRWALHPLALAGIILGSMAVGVLATTLWTSAGGSATPRQLTHTPTASQPLLSDPAAGATNATLGHLIAAEAWLARSPALADIFPDPGLIASQNFAPETVRHIKNVQDDDILLTVWGAKDFSGNICVIAGLPDGFYATQCISQTDFILHSISLGFNGYEVTWDGITTSVTLPRTGSLN